MEEVSRVGEGECIQWLHHLHLFLHLSVTAGDSLAQDSAEIKPVLVWEHETDLAQGDTVA